MLSHEFVDCLGRATDCVVVIKNYNSAGHYPAEKLVQCERRGLLDVWYFELR
jgi:hypothetical protein